MLCLFIVSSRKRMFHLLFILLGILSLVACGTPPASPAIEAPAATVQVAAATASPSPTPAVTTIPSPLATASMTPLPPTATAPLPVESPSGPKTGQPPGELVEALDEAVLIYRRSGGLTGDAQEWIIYPDGRVTSDGRTWQVKPEQVEQLLDDIETLGFFELTGDYMPANTCCDRSTYELAVRAGERVNAVTTLESTPNTPVELWQILQQVRDWLANLS